MIRKKLLVQGRVQGVGFRFFAKLTATELNLTGYAKNLDDGNVLIEVQGLAKDIETLKAKLFKGNGFCKVISIDENDMEATLNETKFNFY